MKEQSFIETIKKVTSSPFIGDDCAYLKDLGIVVTQDNFIEDVHFKREWSTPFQIGYKATVVNISDVLASGAKPGYITVGLSLPSYINEDFIEEFYKGVNAGLNGAQLVGGDVTSADKIIVSITAIGTTKNRNISSRSYAKENYLVITNGEFGTSATGLKSLQKGNLNSDFVKAHLQPQLETLFSKDVSTQCTEKYAMMDTSDGLADALYKIADASGITIKIDSKNIPHDLQVKDLNTMLFGGEDYNLVAAVPENLLQNIKHYKILGKCYPKSSAKLVVDNIEYKSYDELKIYDHFGV